MSDQEQDNTQRPSSDVNDETASLGTTPARTSSPAPESDDGHQASPSRSNRPVFAGNESISQSTVPPGRRSRSPTVSGGGPLSPAATDRVFPIRSVVSMDPTQTPSVRQEKSEGYFQNLSQARRMSFNAHSDPTPIGTPANNKPPGTDRGTSSRISEDASNKEHRASISSTADVQSGALEDQSSHQLLNQIMTDGESLASDKDTRSLSQTDRPGSARAPSVKSTRSTLDDTGPLMTARFKHIVSEGGHAIITGRGGETLQRCEDEPIHIPGAVQGFGLLLALEEQHEGKLIVRMVSENSKRIFGYTPQQLFALDSFTDILSEEQADNLLDHVDFIRDEEADVVTNGPEVFTMSIRSPQRKNNKFWCAMHINERHRNLVICEFELEDDPVNPLVPSNEMTPEPPEDTLNSQPTESELLESTQNSSRPLRVLRSARKRKGEAAAMEVFNIMSQVQEQLASATSLERFLKVLVGVVKELTGFHRVMVYQFDQHWNGRVVTELVDPRATKDLYKGLNFPASDIPKQARDLYKYNKVRMLYDRDQETARLVCRTLEDLENPLDLTHSYLRAMSPIHLKYLGNMAVRSSMSISINAFDELWGLIACHTYGSKGMRVSFPIRKMCRLVGDSASRNIERLSYASRLQARKLINTVPTQNNPSGYIIASSEDLLELFDADFGLLAIRDEAKILGQLEQSQEALAMVEYLRMRRITSVVTSQDLKEDFPDLRYPPGFTEIAGLLLVPLSVSGRDFIVLFRRGQLKEVKWAGNPYEKYVKEGTEGYLEPRKSFKTWSETVVGKSREWTEEQIETAAVLCLVYGKFIEVWRQKEAALQNSQLTRLLLANSAHEVRTPLNAIINYLEIALEGTLDQETRDNLAKSHSASKSLIYVINDLLDLTKTEEGGDLVKDEVFDLPATLYEATDMFKGDARRKNISYEVSDLHGLPHQVIGDQRKVRQAISNVTANAIQNTTQGGVKVEMCVTSRRETQVDVEISIADTGVGMSAKKLDALFRELEQVQTESADMLSQSAIKDKNALPESAKKDEQKTLGLGLAVVARIVRNSNGQLRLKSEEGKGSRFVIQFPFDLPEIESQQQAIEGQSSVASTTPHAELSESMISPSEGMVTLVERAGATRRSSSQNEQTLSRRNSGDSLESKMSMRSLGSMKSGQSHASFASNRSSKSEADRLIEAIQEPHQVEGWYENSVHRSNSRGNNMPSRPKLGQRHSTMGALGSGSPLKRHSQGTESASMIDNVREPRHTKPGESEVTDQGTPLRPVRMPDDFASPAPASNRPITAPSSSTEPPKPQSTAAGTVDAQRMHVLVAEDDPVNSRIIKKRLDRLAHEVFLTVNGEECSSTYCEKTGFFDIVLMDMQMPIVDGLSSTKMIRSFEKTRPTQLLSARAALNGRVPIIAVSASLIEKERQVYIDAGFDGWILKPISFNRLSEIMEGVVDKQVRKENLYQPGSWERGGWFHEIQQDVFSADTRPSGEPPQNALSACAPSQGVQIAAATDGPQAKEDGGDSEQSREQLRLLAEQEEKKDDAPVSTDSEASKEEATADTGTEQS